MNNQQHKKTAICFGEILWDVLPNGAVPGGAPMNVAYHLNKLGIPASIISKVGNDEEGKSLITFLNTHQVPIALVQADENYPTGKVLATPGAHYEMQYDIIFPVAWDFINSEAEALQQVANASHFIFGSLAARNEHSYNSLLRFLQVAKTKVLDINLRQPHFSKEGIITLLTHAHILKLNTGELEMLSGWFGLTGNLQQRVIALSDQFNIRETVITRGENGAAYVSGNQFYEHPGFPTQVVDTVGSGDSFLAGFLSHIINGNGPMQAITFACKLGSFIASQKGACPDYDPQMLKMA